jgi:3-oxoacyl-[acyl-carrier protein] reductase
MEDMMSVYQTNVFGAAMMGQEAAKIFKKQKHGSIVNIGSTASVKGFGKGSIYASSKFALRGLSQCWQADLRPFNVRVMHVNPSEVTTAFGNPDGDSRPEESNKLRPEEIADVIISQLKMDDRGFVPEVTVWATNPW